LLRIKPQNPTTQLNINNQSSTITCCMSSFFILKTLFLPP